MFTDKIWTLYNPATITLITRQTTSRQTNTFFQHLLQTSAVLPDTSYTNAVLLQTPETHLIITAHSTPAILIARTLHPPSLLTAALTTKYESPSPPPQNDDPFHIPQEHTGQFISVISPHRVLAREASCSQFDAKLESPGRINAKTRRERRVQNLLPDIARRRKAEMENPFSGDTVNASQERSRHSSVARDVRQGSVVSDISVGSRLSTVEIQTKEAVKQTVVAALRLHSIGSGDPDYKGLISHTVHAAMFALRGKLKARKIVGMGEMGGVVEGLLDIFLKR
jgi:hypothetical protein